MINKGSWKANGKFLITGEYLVMESAKAFAIPLKFGQSMDVKPNNEGVIIWESYYSHGSWFKASFQLPFPDLIKTNNKPLALKLESILKEAFILAGDITTRGVDIKTILDFDPEFGMGSSSTLISNIANWLNIDPYMLLESTFKGSGYDIACARNDKPIVYQLKNDEPRIMKVDFEPSFLEKVYFVYLNKKQSSSDSIVNFKNKSSFSISDIDSISHISQEIIATKTIEDFERLITEHEQIMSKILKLQTVKQSVFSDFPGVAKSLGAWGGDFVFLTNHESEDKFKNRLLDKGLNTFYQYSEIIK